jgi:2-(1,2-epoxy-1,2-dihydrophenyl)acetyl-CoA isomerase
MAFVEITDHGPIRHLTLRQPERKNAVPRHGWGEIAAAVAGFVESSQRVLVIRGAGMDFCAGADLRDVDLDELASPADGSRFMLAPAAAATALFRCAKPTIAAVDGVAVGAGMSLALLCDFVVATERTRFAAVFARRGLAVDCGGSWLLPRLVGMAMARDLALTGREVDAAEAGEIGLVSRVVPVDQLDCIVAELARELAAGAPLAQRFIKTHLGRSLDLTFEQVLALENQAQAALLASADFREGIAAFLEERPPDFEGR